MRLPISRLVRRPVLRFRQGLSFDQAKLVSKEWREPAGVTSLRPAPPHLRVALQTWLACFVRGSR